MFGYLGSGFWKVGGFRKEGIDGCIEDWIDYWCAWYGMRWDNSDMRNCLIDWLSEKSSWFGMVWTWNEKLKPDGWGSWRTLL